ncbi:MAG: 2-phospho-L-lactate guanylyltransferase [Dehalococcoidia bacterium]
MTTRRNPLATAVVVAVQDASLAKSRLGAHLDTGSRRSLVIAMLDDVLTAVREAHRGLVMVVSADPVYDAVAREHHVEVIRDQATGYNAAVTLALEHLRDRAASVVVLPGDLPQLHPVDVTTLIEAVERPGLSRVVLAASTDGGTAALGLRPLDVISTAFGEDSAQRHREACATAAATLVELDLDSLRVDVDTLEDLATVWAQVGEATTGLIEHLTVVTPGSPA